MRQRVEHWMTRDPIHVREDVSAVEALDRMIDAGIRHLPVIDAEQRLVGILSLDDLRGALPFDVSMARPLGAIERSEAQDYSVSDAMTWAPHTARASDPLEDAARCLAEHRIGCLPVVDDRERLEGILSETDALHALEATLRRDAEVSTVSEEKPGSRELVDALWSERARLVEQLAKWQDTERTLSADLHEEPRDRADRGSDESEVAGLARLSERATRRLRAIERALERAEHGRLGICERCQGRIPATRLRALPEATSCVRCARTAARAEGPD